MFFKKNELERLCCTKEEIELVLEYQKRFPVILDNENNMEKFCIDARELYKGIIQSDDMSNFSRWMKRALNNYRFAENVDFSMIRPIGLIKHFGEGGDAKSVNYTLSLDMAKQLAMVDKRDSGFSARRYFILMEDIVKRNKEWLEVRFPERKEYKDMCTKLSEYIERTFKREADKYDFAREANIINTIATGASAQSIRNYLGVMDNDLTRDSLEKEYNERLAFLQKQNMIYLGMNFSIYDRVQMLISAFDVIYPSASPILPWMTREGYENVRNEMLEQLRR